MPVLDAVAPIHQTVRAETAQLGHHLLAADEPDRPGQARAGGQWTGVPAWS
jgi:hypothetical protein